ncbi:hypothetical protein EPN83_03455 [Patescibacteria group bacterium]|nr:MAG: hypothetical protein EPN83_03455 [Patescibacteria group bacterium]
MKKRSSIVYFISPLLVALTLFPGFQGKLSAQLANFGLQASQLSVTLIPETPGPNESVSIEAESFIVDLNAANISWTVNGKVERRGVGEKRLVITTGGLGGVTTVGIYVQPLNGLPFSDTVTIRPALVDLLWEARTYTPSFYRGKALYSQESDITVAALPHFVDSNSRTLPRENLIYQWSNNGTVLGGVSGYGRGSFTFTGSLFEKREVVAVEVQSTDGRFRAKKSITITPVSPRIVFYENHPLFGPLYNQAVGNEFALKNKEVSVLAVPYFFSAAERGDPQLEFQWSLNSNPAQSQDERDTITLRQEDEARGKSQISLSVQNISRLLQSDKKDFFVSFGQ